MSGGSYRYLCYADSSDINNRREELTQMRDRLTELGFKDAAKETESVLLMLDSFEVRLSTRLERMSDVWKAIEWLDSGDSDFIGVECAIDKYRES
jgi:hypothetical protein